MDVERFAALVARFAANTSEPEGVSAGRLLIREAEKEGVRLIDLFYRPDVLVALDVAIKPVREDFSGVKAENEELRGKLAIVLPKLEELAEEVASLRVMAPRIHHGNRLAWAAKECASMVICVVMFALVASWMDGAFHHSEAAKVTDTARQIESHEFRQVPESVHRPGTLPLLECPEGVKGSACDKYAADWIAAQAPAKTTPACKSKLANPDEDILARIKTPDPSTLAAFVAPVVRPVKNLVVEENDEGQLDSNPVTPKRSLEEQLGDEPPVRKPAGWSRLFGPNYKGGH